MNAHAHEHASDDHGHHHVSSFRSLFSILIVLLIMTALTVYTAKFVDLGELGNLILALVIATFKATLVCAIFMHLLYDKFLNSVALIVCVVLVICFIGFTAIDMKSRGALDPTREHFIGPPPLSEANVTAAIEKANAAHDDHGEAHGDDHADDGHSADEHATDEHADDDHH